MADRTQHKIGRVRPPRVQITYDVEIGDAVETKELPFVVGVVADLAGDNEPKKYSERKFAQIDKENFDEVMSAVAPRLSLVVDNKMDDKSEKIPVDLNFQKLADFNPSAFISQVPKLQEVYEKRQALNALLSEIFVNEELTAALNEMIKDADDDKALQDAINELQKKMS